MASIDITGQRFGRLVAIERVSRPHREWRWRLRCDCGGETVTTVSKVRSGHTQSCGCVQREAASNAKWRHGESTGGGAQQETRLYRIWSRMRNRCSNPKSNRWHRYGGRGIAVCTEWDDYLRFKRWALANGYRDDLSIDRINANGNYEPSNCRWATALEQARNKA
jgi:hypothetical protein